MDVDIRTCLFCGMNFQRNRHQKFCKRKCRDGYHNAIKMKAVKMMKDKIHLDAIQALDETCIM